MVHNAPTSDSQPPLLAVNPSTEAAYAWLSRDTKLALQELLHITATAVQAEAAAMLVVDGGLELTLATYSIDDYVVQRKAGLCARVNDSPQQALFTDGELEAAGVEFPFLQGWPGWTWVVRHVQFWVKDSALIWFARSADRPFLAEELRTLERCSLLAGRELTFLGRNKEIVLQREQATVEIAQLHERLFRQHALYRELAKHLPGTAVLVFDIDLHVRIQEGWQALEWPIASAVQLTGSHVAEYFQQRDIARVDSACRQAMLGHRMTFEIRVAERSYELSTGPLPDPAVATVVFGILVVRDVTRDRLKRAQAAATTARLEALVESLDDGILVEDEHRRVLLCSNRLRTLMQLESGEPAEVTHEGLSLMNRMASICFIPEAFEESTLRLAEARTAQRNELIYLADMRVIERDYVPLAVEGQNMGHLWVYRDVTQREQTKDLLQQQADQLRALSLVDELTGLYNRRGFLTLATQQLKLCDRTLRPALVVFVDLDGMKRINDELGHEFGDQALIETANLLRTCMRNSDVIARLGGDEFVALAIDAPFDTAIEQRLYEALEKSNGRTDRAFELSFSVGIAPYDPSSAEMIEEVLARADALMYEKKRARHAERR